MGVVCNFIFNRVVEGGLAEVTLVRRFEVSESAI